MKSSYKYLLLSVGLLGLQQLALAQNANDTETQLTVPYEKTFTITAYYSPIEGQSRYLKGSLSADKKLNGNGTNGADGTPVYPGMIAAPSSIPFGTKMSIPGIGTVAVHDRGGAIVKAGQRNQKHDRLDIWMGSGDLGLNRALKWGKRNVTVKVYGRDDSIQEVVDFSHLDVSFKDFTSKPTPIVEATIFIKDFGLGDSDPQISEFKDKLKQLSYYNGELSNEFDAKTYEAVLKFQLDYHIIDEDTEFGAGYFGPQTRKTLEKALNGLKPSDNYSLASLPRASAADLKNKQIQLAGNGLSFLDRDLALGDSGQEVLELQTELKKMHLFGIEPTGYYGEVTANAVFKFQQSQGLLADKDAQGAGGFGPLTRQTISKLVYDRIQTREIIAIKEENNLMAEI